MLFFSGIIDIYLKISDSMAYRQVLPRMPQKNVAIVILLFDFELFIDVRFSNSLHPKEIEHS
jgi:hypothetical protein